MSAAPGPDAADWDAVAAELAELKAKMQQRH